MTKYFCKKNKKKCTFFSNYLIISSDYFCYFRDIFGMYMF